MKKKVILFWFRRDLRIADNTALFHALMAGIPVLPIFIFDKNILDKLADKKDKRVQFIHSTLTSIQQELQSIGSGLEVIYATPQEAFEQLMKQYNIAEVYANHDYELYGIKRDEQIQALLKKNNIPFHTYKDQVVFEKSEVVKDDGKPYTIFTPYSRKWKATLEKTGISIQPSEKHIDRFMQQSPKTIISLKDMGFFPTTTIVPPNFLELELIKKYANQRDIPSIAGTSKLGIHLRFGTVSIRSLVNRSRNISDVFLNELIWRDFYQMILWHFPHVNEYASFKPAYELIEWRHDEEQFKKWCTGQTGYPIVDAGMRELNETGFMHNRVRMIAASFLCKHLLIDWRWGEAYFAEKLLDFDFAANNGGWQWAAGSGCDAAPYFRIFNPYLQTKKFDPQLIYIKKWVPEFQELTYPKPIVDHEFARKRCLEVYGKALKPR